ncbi:TraR/DksA family transcriptional regulator [Wolbachia endosymbiont of Pentidionis agamae]|uniref:TraR/DksA family transcriptional regulator n=1 Tax=Wolbachia endosymbiont of Pentidionis agamae TaxID=3110435 RepID=UPI002FD5B1BC
MRITLPVNYIPSEDEEYMNPLQLEYFKKKLESMFDDLTKYKVHQKDSASLGVASADIDNLSFSENEELMERRRKKHLEINEALKRIELGIYGYCTETGEEIGIGRLEANPLATCCIEEQERKESLKNVYNIEE